MARLIICFSLSLTLSCGSTCVQEVLAEIAVTASYRDTMRVGDTIRYTIRVPDQVADIYSGENFSIADYDFQLELLIDELDVEPSIDPTHSYFEFLAIEGNFVFSTMGAIQVGSISLEKRGDERIASLAVVTRWPGKFYFAITSPYDRSVRVIDKQIELIPANDCIEALNLLFPLNNYSTTGFDIYSECVDPRFRPVHCYTNARPAA